MRDDQHFSGDNLVGSVVSLRQHKAVGLAVHGLGTKGRRSQVDALALKALVVEGGVRGVRGKNEKFDQGVFLRT